MLLFYFVVVDDDVDVFDSEEFIASFADDEPFDVDGFFAGAFDDD